MQATVRSLSAGPQAPGLMSRHVVGLVGDDEREEAVEVGLDGGRKITVPAGR